MRKLLFFLLCALLPCFLSAQHFTGAPDAEKPVKQIVEWTTFPADDQYQEETFKDIVYNFRLDGKLSSMILNNKEDEERYYQYDAAGRLNEVLIKNKNGSSKMTYRYQPGLKIAEIKGEGLYLKNMQYLNENGQIVEEKEYEKDDHTGDKIKLVSRKLFNYNNKGKIFGEISYLHNAGQTINRKTVHQYDPLLGQLTKTTITNDKGEVIEQVTYLYNQSGRLDIVEYSSPKTGKWKKTEFRYKGDKLWQEIVTTAAGDRSEKIYLDGRLVRFKEYINEVLEWYTDFQYVYY